jgi:large subunit ribosomal protein L23
MNREALHTVLKRPLITEKANDLKESESKYSFEVAMGANKLDIKRAIETLFKVRVATVRTSIVRGKIKRVGRNTGKRSNWKKAVVTLPAGEAIDFFGEE